MEAPEPANTQLSTALQLHSHTGCATHIHMNPVARSFPKLLSEIPLKNQGCFCRVQLKVNWKTMAQSHHSYAPSPRSPLSWQIPALSRDIKQVTHDLQMFKIPPFLWFLIPFQRFHLPSAWGRTVGCDAPQARGQTMVCRRQKGD